MANLAKQARFPFKRCLLALSAAIYLYYLLPATAVGFYELYHATGFEPVYFGYMAFKAAGYYFSVWEYRLATVMSVALVILLTPTVIRKLRG
ncbi:MAG: hypothetical protein AAGA91_10770 [Pseudomonadota bacterium]